MAHLDRRHDAVLLRELRHHHNLLADVLRHLQIARVLQQPGTVPRFHAHPPAVAPAVREAHAHDPFVILPRLQHLNHVVNHRRAQVLGVRFKPAPNLCRGDDLQPQVTLTDCLGVV